MMPGTVKADSQVEIHDSCNYCCCFGFNRRPKSVEKAARQADKISKQDSPRHVEHKVSHIKIDITQEDDVEFVQGFSVARKTED